MRFDEAPKTERPRGGGRPPDSTATALRVALISFRADIFSALNSGCTQSGHLPALYLTGRSGRPGTPSYPHLGDKLEAILGDIPGELDLLLPGNTAGLARALRGYDIDLAVVCGLSWRLPRTVLDAPRLGILNVHTSLLPRYRGPAPVQWAIRNGDPHIGVTVHWMDDRIDSGNIVAQHRGIALPEFVTFEDLWQHVTPVIRDVLAVALVRVSAGYGGEPQNEDHATLAGLMEPEFGHLDWTQPARRIHNQVRTFYYGAGIPGPFGKVGGDWLRVLRTSLAPVAEGIRIDCADDPIWLVETEPARPPS
ncbi:MAG TPA: formyltransferase family protein [Amycolatopsis sp.]|nr:formyltransferase family protein [Amycolatopsis sp.]